MIGKIFKTIYASGRKATRAVGNSMDFVDDMLEKEYITSTVDKAKEATGDVVQKAGESYQKSRDFIEKNMEKDQMKSNWEKALAKGKEAQSELADHMLETSSTLKNVMNEGREIIRKFYKK